MSLQVWLPLDGKLDNFGLADVTVINVGAMVNSNGKIGSCYYFDGFAHYLQFSKTLGNIYNGDFSLSVWLNPSDDTRSVICSEYSSSGASNVTFELTTSRSIRIYWNGSPDINTGVIVPKNEWNHYVITRNGNTLKVYQNGNQAWTNTYTLSERTSTACIRLGDDYRGGTSVSYMGYMNDFRIYDHCLSAKQVKEISKGLVRHYPLNEIIGNPNLLQSVPAEYNSTAYRAYKLELSQNLEVNKTYTLQFWDVYNKNSNNTSYIRVFWGNGSNPLNQYDITFSSADFYKKYIKISFNITSSQVSSANGSLLLYLYNIQDAGHDYMQIGKWKLEEGSEATPWVPNINDAEYSSYDLGNVVYDCSGYGRNGTLSPTPPTYGSQSPRYFNCMAFNGTNNYIDCGLSGDGNLPTDAITVCGWGYRENWDSDTQQKLISCTQNGGFNFQGKTTQFIVYRNGSYAYATNTLSKTTGWYFFAGTYDGYVVKFYINGQLMASSNDTSATSTKYPISYNSNAKLLIGCEPSGSTPSSPYWNGKISDIRIYCTALSAQDIKELYQSSLSVDNMGNFHTHEIFENTEAQS